MLFCGPTGEPGVFEPYGFLCVPHVGVYGEDYSPCLPMLLVSLPVASLGRLGAAFGSDVSDAGGTRHLVCLRVCSCVCVRARAPSRPSQQARA